MKEDLRIFRDVFVLKERKWGSKSESLIVLKTKLKVSF